MKNVSEYIEVIGASENNLRNISLKIPLGSITCVSGISGSGKSTLVNGVIAKEADRRRRLARAPESSYYSLVRPDFRSIDNLPPVLVVNQKPLLHLQSSSVATASGLGDFLRNAFVRDGVIHCDCGNIVDNNVSYDTLEAILTNLPQPQCIVVNYFRGKEFSKKGLNKYMADNGYYHFYIEGKQKRYSLDDISMLRDGEKHKLYLEITEVHELRRKKVASNRVSIRFHGGDVLDFAHKTFCPACLKEYQVKSLSLFTTSKLSELNGSCEACSGSGKIQRVNWQLLLLPDQTLEENFLTFPVESGRYKAIGIYKSNLAKIIKSNKSKVSLPYKELSEKTKNEIESLLTAQLTNKKDTSDLTAYIKEDVCESCGGSGFNYKARSVTLEGRSFSQTLSLTIDDAIKAIKDPTLFDVLQALSDLSLGHLSLVRPTDTLSGGELQRLKLVRAISSQISGSLIIIDEPSSGLSFRDVQNLFHLMERLRDQGNTVLIVDHSEYIISKSDYSLHLGPGSGSAGGRIVEREIKALSSGVLAAPVSPSVGCSPGKMLVLYPVRHNNVVDQRVMIPFGSITAVVGNSGSGKSSLIQGVLNSLAADSLLESENSELISDAIVLDQKPIRTNKRSSVLTFLGLSIVLRKAYSDSITARVLGLDPTYFTTNGPNGACQYCKGEGEIDEVTCFSCGGARFSELSLSATFCDLDISEFLMRPAVELLDLDLPVLVRRGCEIMVELGLGHLGLGRSLTDISGGEAQRLKMGKFLIENERKIASSSEHILLVLDEPCRGLSTKDTRYVLSLFRRLANCNNSLVIVEHNPFFISQADFVIEVGPGVGVSGGTITYSGPASAYRMKLGDKEQATSRKLLGFSPALVELTGEDRMFSLIKKFSENYEVCKTNSFVFLRSKEELLSFVGKASCDGMYLFNPFCNDFFISPLVSRTTIQERVSEIAKFDIANAYVAGVPHSLKSVSKHINNDNVWDVYFSCHDSLLAYTLGGGWVTVNTAGGYLSAATRVVDAKSKVVGSRSVTSKTFNLFYNGCLTCSGTGEVSFFDSFIENPEKSVIELDFYKKEFHSYLKKNLMFRLRESVALFKLEGLVDLTQSFSSLDSSSKTAAFYGLHGLSFIKKNGRKDALSDRIEWIGLLPTFAMHAKKMGEESGSDILLGRESRECPVCRGSRFRRELSYYQVNGKTIHEELYS
ncbi:MAG: hypothetical protein JKY26_04090 [Pseudomonas sp.]|nr:hypothetical protein [Pseudomonas sp.]